MNHSISRRAMLKAALLISGASAVAIARQLLGSAASTPAVFGQQATDANTYLPMIRKAPSTPTPTPTRTPLPTPTHTTQPTTNPGTVVYIDGNGGNVFTAQDNMLHSGAPDINFGGHDVYDVSVIRRFLQRFNLSAIPKSATLLSARVYYYKDSSVPNQNVTVTIYSVSQANRDWREGGQYGGTGQPGDSTWALRDAAGTPWAGSAGLSTPGVDYETPAIGSFVIPANAQAGQEYVCNLSLSRVAGWLGTPNTNYGILLIANGMAEYIGSAENDNPGRRPKLVVQYTD